MFVASLIDQKASASFLETMRLSARDTIKTNKMLFISYVSKDPERMIDEMCLRDLLVDCEAAGLKRACRYDGDVGVHLIDVVIEKGVETCGKFVKCLCRAGITKEPALSELHQLGTHWHDAPAEACRDAVRRHKRDLAPIISMRAPTFIEDLARHEVLCEHHIEVLKRAVDGIEFYEAARVVDAMYFDGEQRCESFLEMMINPDFLERFPVDRELLEVLRAYRQGKTEPCLPTPDATDELF